VSQQGFGVVIGPLTKIIVRGSGEVVAMTDPPASLAIGVATPQDLADLRTALDAPAFVAQKDVPLPGEGVMTFFEITTKAGTRKLSFGGGVPASAMPVLGLVLKLRGQARTQPLPALDKATLVLTRQEHGGRLGPLESITVKGSSATVTRAGKTAKTEVYPQELTALRMGLLDPILGRLQSTEAGGESVHVSLTVTLGKVTHKLHFNGGVPGDATLVAPLVAILERAVPK
jgi:hypothetical protein